jgi:hypothetical protein
MCRSVVSEVEPYASRGARTVPGGGPTARWAPTQHVPFEFPASGLYSEQADQDRCEGRLSFQDDLVSVGRGSRASKAVRGDFGSDRASASKPAGRLRVVWRRCRRSREGESEDGARLGRWTTAKKPSVMAERPVLDGRRRRWEVPNWWHVDRTAPACWNPVTGDAACDQIGRAQPSFGKSRLIVRIDP